MRRMCSMCGQVKDEEEFKIKTYKNRKSYRNYYCNTCQRLYQREYMRIYRERRRRMSKADEMFEELGYKKQYENESIYYYMDIDLKDNYIVFETEYKSFAKISCYHDAGDITMQELQAINEKVKELRLGEQLNKEIKSIKEK